MDCPACGQRNLGSARFCNECGARLVRFLDNSGAPDPEGVSASGFVGRRREMEELRAYLEGSLSGQGRLVMLVGEPGIGKTRTARELVTYAEKAGFQALWGWCYEGEGAPPYWPWVQMLRSYIQQQDPDQLRSYMGAGAADIAEIIPLVREKLPGLEPPPALEPEQARFRLFDSLTSFLKNAAQIQPLVIVLDDLHWADTPSLLLLQFVAREIAHSRLLVIGAYRDVELSRQHPLSEALGGLAREQLFQRIPLRGLAAEELGLLVQEITGVMPSPGFTQALESHTEGNPFFAVEVVRLLEQEGELTAESPREPRSWRIRIPEGVREVIGRRLNRMSPQCNRVLTIGAVIGREFQLKHLSHLVRDLSEEQLLEALEEALTSRIIEELPGSAADYQFSHALIQETLTSELSAARRVRLHAQIAQVLEQLYSDDLEAHASHLAYHFAEAEPALGMERLVRYSQIAGERALAAYAYEEALSHFQRALAAREGQAPLAGSEPPMDEEMADLLFGLGKAQAAFLEGEQLPEAVSNLSRAFDYYASVGDTEKAISVAEYPVNSNPGFRTGVAHLISRGLEIVPAGSLQAGRLWSRLARALVLEEGSFEPAQDAYDKALEIARREKDVRLEAQALANGAHAKMQQLSYQDALELSLSSLELASEADDLWSECLAAFVAAQMQIDMGNPEQGRRIATSMLTPARKLRSRYYLAGANNNLGYLAASVGNWERARAYYDESFSHLRRDPRVLSRRAFMEYQIGEFAGGDTFLNQLLELMRSTPQEGSLVYAMTALALVRVSGLERKEGRLEIAESAARAHLSAPSATPFTSTFARAALGLLGVERGDVPIVQEQYSWLIESAEDRQSIWGIPMQWVLGLMSHTMGKIDQAAAHFGSSLAYCRKASYRPELAWTCYSYADCLLQCDSPGDREKARLMLDESLEISSELGMRPLMERVRERLALLEPATDRAIGYPNGLTQREVEVLRLVAQGKSNREIGEELVISEGTARRHVSNIYDKIGVSNRAEATRYSLKEGLLSLDEAPSSTEEAPATPAGDGPGH